MSRVAHTCDCPLQFHSAACLARYVGKSQAALIKAYRNGWLAEYALTRGDRVGFSSLQGAAAAWERNADRRQRLDQNHQAIVDSSIDRGEPDPQRDSNLQLSPEEDIEEKSPQGDSPPPKATSLDIAAFWKAKQAELDYKRAAKEVGEVAEYRNGWSRIVNEFRAKTLGIPSRFKQTCPEITVGQFEALEILVRECLEALGNEDP